MLPQCSHITRKRGVYYYRRRLPKPFNGEVAVSLRTSNFRAAEDTVRSLDGSFRQFFASLTMTDFDIQKTLQAYLRKHIEGLREKHFNTPHGQPVHLAAAPGRDYRDDIVGVDHQLRQLRSDLRRRDVRSVSNIVDELAAGQVLTDRQQVKLGLGILQAHIQLLEKSRLWLTDGLAEPIDLSEGVILPPSAVVAPNLSSPAGGPTFSDVLPGFLDLMVKDQGWKGQTLAQNQATYRMVVEWCGERPVTQYTRKDFASFYDMLRSLPKLYSKSKQWRELSLRDIVEQSTGLDTERLSMKTVKRHFSALGRLFSYLKKRGEYEGENPAYGFEFPDKGRAKDKRKIWSGEQLTRLFASPVWTGCHSEQRRSKPGKLVIKDEKFWLPLLGIFHGNRLEEFAQLHRSDLRCEEGIWFLDINDEGVKQVKNEQSKRRVPLHPNIVQLGFLKYVEDAAPNGGDRIFPLLRPGGPDKKLGYYFTKWWTRYRRDVDVYEKSVDYHSFRHNVTTKLAAANVSLDVRNELLGREGGSIDQRVYLKGLPLPMLRDAIEMVQWPEIDAELAKVSLSNEQDGDVGEAA